MFNRKFLKNQKSVGCKKSDRVGRRNKRWAACRFEALEARNLLATLVTADISANTTWTAAESPYILQNNISVLNGASLTIQDGVQVQAKNSSITLNVGTSSQSGTLSSVSATAGGIHFATNVDVSSSGVAAITKNDFVSGQLRINSGSNVTLTDNTFHGGADQASTPIWIDPALTARLDGNTFTTAGTYIGILSGTIALPQTWKKLPNVDGYRLLDFSFNDINDDVTVNSTLTIEAGNSIIRDRDQNSIIVNGTLNAEGTVAQPVGIELNVTAAAGSMVNFQQVDSGVGILSLSGAATVQNTDFLGSSRLVVNSGSSVTLADNTFHGGADQNSIPVWMDPALTAKLDGNTFTTAGTYVGILNGTISLPHTWKKLANVDGYRLLDFSFNDINDDVTVNSSLTIEAGNSIIRDRDQNSIIVNGTLSAMGTLAQPVGIGLNVTAAAGSTVNFQQVDTGVGILSLSGAATIQNTDFLGSSRLVVNNGSNVTLADNTFHGGADQNSIPVWIDPALTGKLDGNTFTTAGTYIGILSGAISTPLTWKKLANVDGYRLLDFSFNNINDDVTVNSTLTIEAGNSIIRDRDQNSIIVNGGIIAAGTAGQPVGIGLDVTAASGSTVNFQQVDTGLGILSLSGTATIQNSDFLGSSRLVVNNGSSVTLADNTFHGGADQNSIPVWIDPALTAKLDGNTFTTSGTYIGLLSGTISSPQTWKKLDNVEGYRILDFSFNDVNDDITINSTLTIEAGNSILRDRDQNTIVVNGTLNAVAIYLAAGVNFTSTSAGFFRENKIVDGATIRIDSNSTALLRDNTFLGLGTSTVIGTGDTSKTIDLTGNFWGTTDIPTIESRIQDTADPVVGSRPDINVTNPVALNTLSGTVWRELNVDGVYDFAEPAISGVIVRLFDAGNDAAIGGGDDVQFGANQITNSKGHYAFAGLVPTHHYYVEVVKPANFGFTIPDVGHDFADSDVDSNGRTAVLQWIGAFDPSWDVGLFTNEFSIQATSANLPENNSGTTPFSFTVTRTGLTTSSATVNYNVTGSAINGATADDFMDAVLPSGTVAFAPGEISQLITINVLGDTTVENDEDFIVTLNTPSDPGMIKTPTATGTIQNDDIDLSIAATSAEKLEGNTGNTQFTFTVTRSGLTSVISTVGYVVAGSAINGATADDFGGVFPAGTISFAVGETSKVITVNVNGDLEVESDEGFIVTLLSASGSGPMTPVTANGTIQNDDLSYAIAATSSVITEGNSGTKPFTFTITRSGLTSGVSTVDYVVTGSGVNGATADDFGGTFPSGTISFAAGEVSKTIIVNVHGDTLGELDEDFIVTLDSPSGTGTIATATANGTIQNDDLSYEIAATASVQAESDSATTPFTFTVTRSGLTNVTGTVDFVVTGSPVDGATADDFGGTFPSGTISFAADEIIKTITVNVSDDVDVEVDEDFIVTLNSPSGIGTITIATAIGTIQNDDLSYAIEATSGVNAEGDSATMPFAFSVTRSGLTSVASSVDYEVTGSAVDGATADDFGGTFPSGTISFAAGEISKTITVIASDDGIVESDEDFIVTLHSPSGTGTIATATANGTIQNDDVLLDYGDAPVNYPVSVVQDGARHAESLLFLGETVDFEVDGVNSETASDDGIDEDGVFVVASPVTSTTVSTQASFLVTASQDAKLDGWIDFNADGDWSDSGEQIFTSVPVIAGDNILGYSVPQGAKAGTTFARFRLSSTGGLEVTGAAADGEVEDYMESIADGDSGSSVTINIINGSVVVLRDESDSVVRSGDIELFRALSSLVASLSVNGTATDDNITIDFGSGFTLPSGGLVIAGSGGNNTLSILGGGTLDLTDPLLEVTDIPHISLSGDNVNRVILDVAAIQRMSASQNTVSVTIGAADVIEVKQVNQWRMIESLEVDGKFTLQAQKQDGVELIRVETPRPFQNFLKSGDVNNDGVITASDALDVINELNQRRYSDLQGKLSDPLSIGFWPGIYFDSDGNGIITAADALKVINELPFQSLLVGTEDSEPEATDVVKTIPFGLAESARFDQPRTNYDDEYRMPIASSSIHNDASLRPTWSPSDATLLENPVSQTSTKIADELLSNESFLNELALASLTEHE
mgnify:CR=1 FL=1